MDKLNASNTFILSLSLWNLITINGSTLHLICFICLKITNNKLPNEYDGII